MGVIPGTRLGNYEILSLLGAGGMGEVYRARDTRLGRDVAVKVLPVDVSADQERLRRFEKEAKSASALNHPNIVTIYDIGSEGRVSYIAMELIEGATLRELVSGPLPIKKLLQIAPQITGGLARAHEAGIVHRDLKPENVMVKKDGLVKILDFGLAKLTSTGSGSGDVSQLPTMTGTQPGVVVGTVGYMSPEQASGKAIDFRSDQFSFGSILYEIATGRRAFQKKTAIDTLSAILNEEPEPIAAINPQAPAPLRWIVERCHAKEPEGRYASTEDLARDLASVRDHISEVSGSAAVGVSTSRSPLPRILGVFGMAALVAGGYFAAALRSHPAPVPRFQRVTFQKGAVWRARFAADGQTVVYSMQGVGNDNKPAELYSTQVGSLDSRSLGLPPADILSISRSGQMAILLAPADKIWWGIGTLAEAALSGGTPRQILEDVTGADWGPGGKDLAVLHNTGGKRRLEYPVGKVLYETTNRLWGLRVSPDGETVAFGEVRPPGTLRVADRKGAVRTLVETEGKWAWLPRGDELLWIKEINMGGLASEVHVVTLRGRDRVVTSLPGDFRLHDLASDGRMLVERVSQSFEIAGVFPGDAGERSLAWLDNSIPAALSADGRMLLFSDRGDTGGTGAFAAYLRKTDGSPPVRLGEGFSLALSADGKWALAHRKTPKPHLVLIPTGADQERSLSPGPVVVGYWAQFHPDGKRVFFEGSEPGHPGRAWEQSLEAGPPRPATPEGLVPRALSPDGALLAGVDGDRNLAILPTGAKAGTAPRTLTQLSVKDEPLHWSADGRSLLIANYSIRPVRVDRIDLSSGRRSPWRSFSPGGLTGSGGLETLVLAANEQALVAGYRRYFSELLVIDGLK